VHYHIALRTLGSLQQGRQTSLQNPARSAPPPGVQQGHSPPWGDEIHRNAVGYGYGKQNTGRSGDPAVDTLDLAPALRLSHSSNFHPVDLIAEDHRGESRHGSSELEPATHNLTYRLRAPQAEVKPASGSGAPPGDPRGNAVVLLPARYLKGWHRAGNWLLGYVILGSGQVLLLLG
jgi:hypothetical protein